MIGVALVALITILASSTKASIGATIDQAFRADYIVAPKAGGFGGSGFSPELADKVKALPEIQTATGLRFGAAELDGNSKFLIAADPKALNELFDLRPANTGRVREPGGRSDRGVEADRRREGVEDRRHGEGAIPERGNDRSHRRPRSTPSASRRG